LNIRSGPATEYPIIGKALAGEVFLALGRDGAATWVLLQVSDLSQGVGWVSVEFVTLTRPVVDLPISNPDDIGTTGPAAPTLADIDTTANNRLTGRLVVQTASGGAIYVYDFAANSLRLLTGGFDPAISPDGRTVAFTRSGGESGLYLIDIDGRNERRIFAGGENLRMPSWSSDGRWIVFTRSTGAFECRDLGFGICLPDNPFLSGFPMARKPEWSLGRVDVNGENYRDLPALNTAQAPDWNEAGIVYHSSTGLEITEDKPEGDTRLLLSAPYYQDPDWQPGGGRIVFQSREGSHWEIFAVNPDGTGLVALTRPVTTLVDQLPYNVSPAWSPDGKHIVYLGSRNANNAHGDWRIWVMDADGSNQRPLEIDLTLFYTFAGEQMVSWGPAAP
jgi:Tol biopolymer transport system component